jgi:hypothetical protein
MKENHWSIMEGGKTLIGANVGVVVVDLQWGEGNVSLVNSEGVWLV